MTLPNLLDEFNVVIDTAEGLTQLRSLILGLAVRGKLVSQDPNDEPASELLKKVKAEKMRLYEEGGIRKPKKVKSIKDDEIPYKLPVGWKWVRLGEISTYGNHDSMRPEEISDDTWVLELADIEKDTSRIVEVDTYQNRKSKSNKYRFQEGDVLYGKLRPYLNKVVIAPNPGVCSTEIIPLKCFAELVNKYLLYALKRDDFLEYANSVTYGTKMPRLGTKDGRRALVPLPPATEQHRIVQKIESLFAEVDELEAKLNRQIKLDEKLQLAVNAYVQQAPDAEASKSAWTFITSNFETLHHTPEAIDNLKKNILNEAVRGRLVPQSPNDEPTSELLKKIEAEKQRLYDEGEIRKPKDLPPVDENEVPFEIPESWTWTHYNELCILVTDGAHHTPEYVGEGVPFLSVKDLSSRFIDFSDTRYNSEETHEELTKRCNPEKGDLLLTKVGTTGIPVVVDTDREFSIFVSVALLKLDSEFLDPEFMKYTFESPFIFDQTQENTKGVGNKNLVLRDIKSIKTPFPPLEEQHRIVQRIEELFAICDRFKAQLEQRQQVNKGLVKGLVGEVLEGS